MWGPPVFPIVTPGEMLLPTTMPDGTRYPPQVIPRRREWMAEEFLSITPFQSHSSSAGGPISGNIVQTLGLFGPAESLITSQ